ncbi:hypothetical protein, variant [Sphaeroforma arctica JP610]|uniref:3-hydroxyacyl-CoA dehydrogenase NAD binding domain-containing protein n=1 Tax=Sphaeroforma arctica JP610 TaxID=667725 RepID=A0A0L0G3I3_9EUKA|nr:hypothetical protein, variant [Sphaeroforma arctica JP610]KNC83429.1 hypothetical protein, variant [Sphaeroforma arctica JP610]|eukprot:XP_014157331.1 hypothetical protein, variant [Sphaeroforma arctica JP610]
MKKTFGNYPAPLAILDCVEAGYKQGPIEGKRKEVESYTSLSVGEESLALRSLFDGQKQCAVNRYVNKGEPKPSVDKVAILGAGLMGSGIAQVSIQNAKHKVWLLDRSADAAALGVNRVEDVFRKRVRKKTMTQMKCDTMLSELKLTTDVTDLKRAFMFSRLPNGPRMSLECTTSVLCQLCLCSKL